MRTYFDCIPCMVRQALDAARLASDDPALHEEVLRKVLRATSEMDLRQTPPAMGLRIHRWVRDLTGNEDPYRELKDSSNALAFELLPELKALVERSADPLATAVRLAIAGNVIDAGVQADLPDVDVRKAIEQSLAADINIRSMDEFRCAVEAAPDILYLCDNAGEIVLDRLLIERLPAQKVTAVVRGRPTINDATMADAVAAGLTELVEVVDNGSDSPGTILGECSAELRQRFESAGLVIAKGQGNYETLSDERRDIFFLLRAKCPVIARYIGCELGSAVIARTRRTGAGAAATGIPEGTA